MIRQGVIKRDFSWPLQKALKTRLDGASLVKIGTPALPVKVFDFSGVEKGTAYPYVTIGDQTEVNEDTKTTSGQEMTFNIHIWSGYFGTQEITSIADQILRSLTSNPLDMSADGFQMVWLRKDAQIPSNMSGLYMHLILRFRTLIEDVQTVQPLT